MFKLKIFLFIYTWSTVFAGSIPSSNEILNSSEEKILSCIIEVGLTSDEVSNLPDDGKLPEQGRVTCVLKCLGEKYGLMYADGTLNVREARKQIALKNTADGTPDLEQVIRKCKKLIGSNPCETATKIYNCFLDAGAVDVGSIERIKNS